MGTENKQKRFELWRRSAFLMKSVVISLTDGWTVLLLGQWVVKASQRFGRDWLPRRRLHECATNLWIPRSFGQKYLFQLLLQMHVNSMSVVIGVGLCGWTKLILQSVAYSGMG